MESINLGNLITLGEECFLNADVARSITLPEYLVAIEDMAFYLMRAYNADLVLSDSVTNIGNNAFASMNVNSLKLPNNDSLVQVSLLLNSVNEIYVPENILRINRVSDNLSEVTLYMYGPERTIKNIDYGTVDLTQFKEVIWNYTD